MFTGCCYWIFSNNKKIQCIFIDIDTCKIWGITLGSFCFLFKIFPKTVVLIQVTFLYSCFFSKVLFIVVSCTTFENFEWNLLIQFPKYCKTGKLNSHPYLIPIIPRISLLLSEYVVVP